MKIAVLGDTHGRDLWKQLNNYDLIIFQGDYLDNFDVKPQNQINNFKNILKYKKNHNVILLLGNHDYHYLTFTKERYSGFQSKYYYTISDLFMENLDCFQIGYSHGNFLFTHAGVTQTWWQNISDEDFSVKLLNDFLKHKPTVFGFQYSTRRSVPTDVYGNNTFQGPLWIRPDSLIEDAIEGYQQIVGHTQHGDIIMKDNFIFTDALEQKKYLEIENYDTVLIKNF